LKFLEAYPADEAVLASYARMARTAEGFDAWLGEWLGEARAEVVA
jgi:hypothetical protein